jgi:hypothetical protein
MRPKVYVETSVLGYLTTWPSGDLVVAGRQKVTHDWWRYALNAFDLVVSELVLQEASAGDPQAVRDRLEAIKDLPVLVADQESQDLAGALVARGAVPSTERADAAHIAAAVVNGIEYLVT